MDELLAAAKPEKEDSRLPWPWFIPNFEGFHFRTKADAEEALLLAKDVLLRFKATL